MKLLYLSEDYSGSKVHHELIYRLVGLGISTHIFTVVRSINNISDIRKTFLNINYDVSEYLLPRLLLKPYRFIFSFKKWLKLRKVLQNMNLDGINVIHAATLFSEGAVAYELHKLYSLPYTVAVRGSDIDFYLSKMPHLWKLGQKILCNASNIIFISPMLQQKFFQKRPIRNIESLIKNKCEIISNGIEDYWIANRRNIKLTENRTRNNVIYIGRFDKNKNVETLLKAVLKLRAKIPGIKITLVGGGGDCHQIIMKYCEEYPDCVSYLGKIFDKDKLRDVFRANDVFAMISHSETFGLVYLEALSQGLPILYSRGQGIDGTIADAFGEKTNSHSVDETSERLEQLLIHTSDYKSLGDQILKYSWDVIAERYNKIFKDIAQT